MSNVLLVIETVEKKGVLSKITDIFSKYGINISYAHIYIGGNDVGYVNVSLEDVDNVDELVSVLKDYSFVRNVFVKASLEDIYGKRVLIFGGGAQVSQVALGAITEADRHNIRGERISIDTIPLVGENDIAGAVDALSSLPRVKALVLAGSIMGGAITEAIREIKLECPDLIVISLNMVGSAAIEADLIVTAPIQAGVMAVMTIADTAVFDINKLESRKF